MLKIKSNQLNGVINRVKKAEELIEQTACRGAERGDDIFPN